MIPSRTLPSIISSSPRSRLTHLDLCRPTSIFADPPGQGHATGNPFIAGLTPRCLVQGRAMASPGRSAARSEEHTSELQSRGHLVCRLLLEKKNANPMSPAHLPSSTSLAYGH